jgi:archaellum component FlaC
MDTVDLELQQIKEEIQKINSEIEKIVNNFKETFGKDKPYDGKIVLYTKKCSPPCRWCPHGPYWGYMRFTRLKNGNDRFKVMHIGTELNSYVLKIQGKTSSEQKHKLFSIDKKINELRQQKNKLVKTYRKLKKEFPLQQNTSNKGTLMICPHCKKTIRI